MRARAAAVTAVTAVLALALAGCVLFTPPETSEPYDPSDGVGGEVGEVTLANVLVVTTDGVLGNLSMTAVNAGASDVTLNIQYQSDGAKHDLSVAVPTKSSEIFGSGANGQLLLTDIGVKAGGLLDIYFQYGSEPGTLLRVPVLDGGMDPYSTLTPTPTPVPLPSPTGDLTPSPTPSG